MPGQALVDARHRIRQHAIADTVAARLSALLVTMPNLEQEQLDRYVADAFPLVAGGQRLAADTGAGYAAVLATPVRGPRPRPKRPVDVDRALQRSGVLVEPDSRSLVAPPLRARRLVAEGNHLEVALRAAASYAGDLSSNDLQAAMRVGVGEGAAAVGLETQGWRKSLSPDACPWCQDIADNVYDDPESIPFHDGDRCGAEPDLGEPAVYVFDDSDIPF